jgi:hypothetical protein
MQRRRFLTSTLTASATAALSAPSAQPAETSARQYYELRRYHLVSGPQQKLTSAYLEQALIPGLNRLGMNPVGVFDLYLGPETPSVYVLIPANSIDALVTSEFRLAKDDEYLRAGEPFLKAPAKEPPFERVESSLLSAFEGYPKLTVPPVTASHGKRVFQLRTYESPSVHDHQVKVEMFNSGEYGVFERAGFWSVFYGDTLIGPRLPNLTYMLSFPDLADMDKMWTKFSADPEWKKLSGSSKFSFEAIVSNIANFVLKPTAFSQI